MKIAIVGAGLAGVTCGRQLHAAGAHVSLYEKSRGAGGRMATRRTADGLRFDHGAQYFTLRDRRFLAAAEAWKQSGLIAPWSGTIVEIASHGTIDKTNDERFVAVPAMNALCKHLAEGLTMHTQVHVGCLEPHDDGWEILSTEGQFARHGRLGDQFGTCRTNGCFDAAVARHRAGGFHRKNAPVLGRDDCTD